MSFLNQEDELKVFACPGCRRPISSLADTCKYCNLSLSDDIKSAAIAASEEDNRSHDVDFHRNIALIGVVICVGGLGLLTMSVVNIYSGLGGFFIWSPVLTVVGFGQTIYGLFGMRKAKRR
jgi:hypothetical protein